MRGASAVDGTQKPPGGFIMGMTQKRDSLAHRKSEIERELTGLGESRQASQDNTALGDLERALMAELDQVDRQLHLLDEYVKQLDQSSQPAGR